MEPNGRGIYSACELPEYDGMAGGRIPRTSMQTVLYHEQHFHGFESNGSLGKSSHRVLARKTGHMVFEASVPVGACVHMYINMLHEGLTCLGLLHAGILKELGYDAFQS